MATELQISGLPSAVSLALGDQLPMDDPTDVSYKYTRTQQNTFLANYFVLKSALQAQSFVYAADTGAANAYVIAPSPAIAAYADGQFFSFVATHANTIASTIAVNGLAAKAIVTNDGSALSANAILANGSYGIQYSTALGGKFVLLNPSIPLGGGYLPLAGGTMSGAINMGAQQLNNVADPTHVQDAVTVTYLNTALAAYLLLAGGTMSGAIAMGSHAITGLSDPSGAQDAMTLHYAGLHYLALAGGTMAGGIAMGGFGISGLLNPVAAQDAVTLSYLETFTGSYLPLAGGTMSGAINMGGFAINNLLDPVGLQDAATKNYVNNIAGGLNPIDGVYGASTANLTGYTYNNVGGVGDTLTAPGNGVFTQDGVSPPVSTRWLYKNDTDNSGIANGIWSITTSNAGAPAVLTRATDYNTASQIKVGDLISVEFGTANGTSSWYQTATVVTVGTSPISFSVWFNPASYVNSALTSGKILLGNGSNFAAPSTATYPNTVATNSLMYASGTNTWAALASVMSAVLVTNGSGVPSFSTTLPSGLTIPGYLGTALAQNSVFAGNGANLAAANTLTALIDAAIGNTQGNILYRNATVWTVLAPSTAGYVLQTGGTSGNPSWVASGTGSTGRFIGIQVFTSTGSNTYNPSVGANNAYVELWAAGGGGGTNNSTSNPDGGGGAGAYSADYVAVSGSVTIVIGTGGNGQLANNGTAGTDGGNTTYGSTVIVAAGGSHSPGAASTGGVGGTVAGCTGKDKRAGGNGSGYNANAQIRTPGGSSPGLTPFPSEPGIVGTNGQANTGQGGGGGNSAIAGGSGGSGYAVVWEYS